MIDPITLNATTMAAAIRRGSLSSREAVEASLSRIEDLDPIFRAFIRVDAQRALAQADACDQIAVQERSRSLHGVPVAVKDLANTAGLTTTYGSSLYRDHVPASDELSVARLKAAGAIIVGKTNTPEFGFGAICTNRLCGPTVNPWGEHLTSGGSSGGSAVAVTTGMVALAHGSDFGGSVRTPASFCGCVGLRPTPGVIPEPTRPLAWSSLATQGVLARTVDDAALMLRAMRGMHAFDPTSSRTAPEIEPPDDLRLAVSPDLSGAFPIDADVRSAFAASVDAVAGLFTCVTEDAPNVDEASEAFKTLRAAETWLKAGALVEANESELTASFVWNVRQGRHITAEAYLRAEAIRSRTYRAFQKFFERFDILMLPSASVLPFPNEQGEVWTVGGKPCDTIIDYLACTYLISLVGFPCLSLPAIWTRDGVPFGVQLVARPDHESTLLKAALRLEEGAGFCHRWPVAWA